MTVIVSLQKVFKKLKGEGQLCLCLYQVLYASMCGKAGMLVLA